MPKKPKMPELPVEFRESTLAELTKEKVEDYTGHAGNGLTLDKTNRQRRILAKGDAVMLSLRGQTGPEIRQYLADKYGYADMTCKDITTQANTDIERIYERYAKKAAEYQYAKLEAIANQCLELGKYSDALKAIDLQNKITKLYNDTYVNNTLVQGGDIKIQFA